MNITVRFFALARDLAGTGLTTVALRDATNVADAIGQVVAQFAPLRSIEPRLATAVNQEYVSRDHVLKDGDELALIPPVSGG